MRHQRLQNTLKTDRRCTDVRVEAVGHELELAIGRNEGDGAVVVKARQTNTLMELDVFQLDRLALAACSSKCTH